MCDYLIFILCFFTITHFKHVLFVSRLMIFKLIKPTRTVFVFSILISNSIVSSNTKFYEAFFLIPGKQMRKMGESILNGETW